MGHKSEIFGGSVIILHPPRCDSANPASQRRIHAGAGNRFAGECPGFIELAFGQIRLGDGRLEAVIFRILDFLGQRVVRQQLKGISRAALAEFRAEAGMEQSVGRRCDSNCRLIVRQCTFIGCRFLICAFTGDQACALEHRGLFRGERNTAGRRPYTRSFKHHTAKQKHQPEG